MFGMHLNEETCQPYHFLRILKTEIGGGRCLRDDGSSKVVYNKICGSDMTL